MNSSFVPKDVSDLVVGQYISTDHLHTNDVVQVGWQPGRVCQFRYLGHDQFVVEHSVNSKLSIGDTFSCLLFVLGQPLLLDHVYHQGQGPALYMAGKSGGLTEVTLLQDGQAVASDVLPEVEALLRSVFPGRIFSLSFPNAKQSMAPLPVALSNAVRYGIMCVQDGRLVFPSECPEVECGYLVHQLKANYSFASWGELEQLVVRQKADGSYVKSLRQLRIFNPKEGTSSREAELDRLIFGSR